MENDRESLGRRGFLRESVLVLGFAGLAQSAEAPAIIDNPKGNFRFRKGSKFSSGGTVAVPGYEIVHVTFNAAPPMEKALEQVDRFLSQQHRPPQALCGIELRSPKPFTFAEFGKLSDRYWELLSKRNLMIGE